MDSWKSGCTDLSEKKKHWERNAHQHSIASGNWRLASTFCCALGSTSSTHRVCKSKQEIGTLFRTSSFNEAGIDSSVGDNAIVGDAASCSGEFSAETSEPGVGDVRSMEACFPAVADKLIDGTGLLLSFPGINVLSDRRSGVPSGSAVFTAVGSCVDPSSSTLDGGVASSAADDVEAAASGEKGGAGVGVGVGVGSARGDATLSDNAGVATEGASDSVGEFSTTLAGDSARKEVSFATFGAVSFR